MHFLEAYRTGDSIVEKNLVLMLIKQKGDVAVFISFC